jgi:hypothetical protein
MAKTGDTSTPEKTTLYVNLAGLRSRVQAAADADGRTLTNMTTRLLVLGLAVIEQQNATDAKSRQSAPSAGSC